MNTWNVRPEAISVGSFSVRWYGLLFAGSFYVAFQVMRRMFEAEKVRVELLDRYLIYMIIGTIGGARLGHTLFYEPEIYLRDPLRILKIWEGGLASHGAALGIVIGVWLFCRRYKLGMLWLLDRSCIPAAFAGFMIRLGNLFNSEIIGRPTDVPWAVVFRRVDPLPRHPAQLYESISYLLIFLLLYSLFWRTELKKARGFFFGVFLFLVFGVRIILESFKENQVAFESSLPLNLGQLLSIPLVVTGVVFMVLALHRNPISRRSG